MALAGITIAGWTLTPAIIEKKPQYIGGTTRRSVNGKGWRKIVCKKNDLTLRWDVLTPEEEQILRIVLSALEAGAVAVSCSDPVISGNYLLENDSDPVSDDEESSGLLKTAELKLKEQ
jgi:hypothetical protein